MEESKVKKLLQGAKDFAGNKEYAEAISTLDITDAPGKLHLADHFIKKEWKPTKNRFKYIYSKDLEKEGRKISKESMTASKKKSIPNALKIKTPADSKFTGKQQDELKGGKADNKSDSNFDINSIHEGMKVEAEHTDSPKLAKEIAKDHLAEHKNYYPALKKMEKRLETQDVFSTEVINGSFNNNIGISNTSAKAETADGAIGRSWTWKSHDYSQRVGPKGEYKYEYKGEISPGEEKARRDVQERNEKIQNQKLTGSQVGMTRSENTRQVKPVESSNPQATDQYKSGTPREGSNMAEFSAQAKESTTCSDCNTNSLKSSGKSL
jgi:hypothetical protein